MGDASVRRAGAAHPVWLRRIVRAPTIGGLLWAGCDHGAADLTSRRESDQSARLAVAASRLLITSSAGPIQLPGPVWHGRPGRLCAGRPLAPPPSPVAG